MLETGCSPLEYRLCSAAEMVEARGVTCGVDDPAGGSKLAGEMTAISTLHLGASVQYHVVSEMPPSDDAQPVAPSLDDATYNTSEYIWLMQDPCIPVRA